MKTFDFIKKQFVLGFLSSLEISILDSGAKITYSNFIEEEFEEDDNENWIEL